MEESAKGLYIFGANNLRKPHANNTELYTGEPVFENHPELLRKYFKKTANVLGKYFKEKLDTIPYFGNVKVSIEELPTYCLRFVKNEKEYLIPIAKIFGLYDTETGSIKFDPSIFKELKSRVRDFLIKYGWEIPKTQRVSDEEYIHLQQDNKGLIDKSLRKYGRKAVDFIEGAASYISDKLSGETGIYEGAKKRFKKLVDKFGEKKAFYGDFAASYT